MDLEELYFHSKELTKNIEKSLPTRVIDVIDINPNALPFGTAFRLIDTKNNYISKRDTFGYAHLDCYNFADTIKVKNTTKVYMPCREYFEKRGYKTDFKNSVYKK